MDTDLGISAVARLTGLTIRAIRFYESSGFLPPVHRSESGYREYSTDDLRRLRLVHQLRELGMPLAEIKPVVAKAIDADCLTFAGELTGVLERQRQEIDQRMAALASLQVQIDELTGHVAGCRCAPGVTIAECDFYPILDGEGGECHGNGSC